MAMRTYSFRADEGLADRIARALEAGAASPTAFAGDEVGYGISLRLARATLDGARLDQSAFLRLVAEAVAEAVLAPVEDDAWVATQRGLHDEAPADDDEAAVRAALLEVQSRAGEAAVADDESGATAS